MMTISNNSGDPVIWDENDRLRLELPDGRADDRRVYPVPGAVLQGFVDQVNELRAERDQLKTADPLAPIREQARRYFTAVHGPDWHYKAPEQWPNLVEQWIWALAADDLTLAETVMAKLETMAAEAGR